jgi:hypothetical protein
VVAVCEDGCCQVCQQAHNNCCVSLLMLLLLLQSRFQDSMLGRVQIPVADVARNGCLKDTWALLVSAS